MAILPPKIQTYHCICTSLLLASTHTLSTLPRRAPPSLDGAYILPVPSHAPSFSHSHSHSHSSPPSPGPNDADDREVDPEAMETSEGQEDGEKDMQAKQDTQDRPLPAAGYTLLLGMQKDSRVTIIRREDGFEKRALWRCGRCSLVIGYEIAGSESRVSGAGEGRRALRGRCTGVMVEGRKIGEGDMEVGREGRGVWE
ncbi:hypothetical protein D0Z07_4134 [Hyphodiscus hymeniophilus]|uniref:STEEP1 domain-containing protein n=1 Tax=Hyphodiscus hymeniophilus TaxID=353542 RepID=A0A9P6VKK8_9HELO|nr:hypothetical protein D0Z07_4134 [Hyphodiscus hymeniophilus]